MDRGGYQVHSRRGSRSGTNENARRFRRYRRVIQAGDEVVVHRALQRLKDEAEWRKCVTGALADR